MSRPSHAIDERELRLEPTGPPAPCGFPGCVLEAFHDGNHRAVERRPSLPVYHCVVCGLSFQVYENLFPSELRTCGSAECILRLASRDALNSEPILLCPCAQRHYPHELRIHHELRGESYNPKRRFLWPWSLMLSPRVELSTERKAA